MLNATQLRDFAKTAESGSPALVHAFGRVFGLGQAERDALSKGAVPGWALVTLGLAAGFVAGVQVYRRWPSKVPAFVKGT
jgi:hypothetical protein